MSSLTASQQAAVRNAREALARSHRMALGSASDRDLCHNIGRLEVALEAALRVIAEHDEETS
ncbi:hypothetical protein [Streptomyces globosus]|uniref:hypothetical protein n=1 Tax=Streptomyces globosus TaxID=68209 RepID=UPI0031E22778